ncbi:hypothetical protein AS594_38835 [Streptomyces agglomeratus]|uniref:Uncharacterized protein n=1 Tax=Streptomyces agglomeratus TaxID=285458 RepID=A0A1E5NYX5_9ACTN|nr:hypothetical protein [Streptomyces agglomeratus]OEJ21507.1 hypothetical protein AS594_38835 [Streptomyces agglomeratus]
MITPWRSAAAYAARVTLGSWSIALIVAAAYSLSTELWQGWGNLSLFVPTDTVILAAQLAALTLARKLRTSLPRWKVTAFDGPLYTAVLLTGVIISSLVASDGPATAVDAGFYYLVIGMFTLQLPAAYLISWLASRRLTVAVPAPKQPRDLFSRAGG